MAIYIYTYIYIYIYIYIYHNDESVFCTFLDATKVFDRVNYVILFKLLVDRMFPPASVRLLINMYTSQVCHVSWNVVCSVPFSVLNGVKLGGIIRSVLLCIYLDELLGKLAEAVAAISGIFSLALLHS